MLPDTVIAQFSLDEGAVRPALSIYVDIDAVGVVDKDSLQLRAEMVPMGANLRLENLEHLVTEESLADESAGYAYRQELSVLWAAAKLLHAGRQEQRVANGLRAEQLGALDPNALARDFHFQIKEVDGSQRVEITPRQRGSILDTIVAEWMIYCNSASGRLLADHGIPGLFRTQKGWGPLRTRMQTTPGPHEGLGLDYYAWCTSPLRRYSDLVNQWQLIAIAKHGITAKMVVAKQVFVRHLKEGMSRVEPVPLHLPVPELATRPRMTRAEVSVADVDLLQLTAGVRVLHIETPEVPESDASPA